MHQYFIHLYSRIIFHGRDRPPFVYPSSIDGHLGRFHVLLVVNRAAVKAGIATHVLLPCATLICNSQTCSLLSFCPCTGLSIPLPSLLTPTHTAGLSFMPLPPGSHPAALGLAGGLLYHLAISRQALLHMVVIAGAAVWECGSAMALIVIASSEPIKVLGA